MPSVGVGSFRAECGHFKGLVPEMNGDGSVLDSGGNHFAEDGDNLIGTGIRAEIEIAVPYSEQVVPYGPAHDVQGESVVFEYRGELLDLVRNGIGFHVLKVEHLTVVGKPTVVRKKPGDLERLRENHYYI